MRGVVRGGVIRERPTYPAARCEAVRGWARRCEVGGGAMRCEGARRCEAGGGAGRGCEAGVRGGCGLTGSHGQRTMRPCTCTSQHPRRGRVSRGCHSKGTEQGLSDCREAWRLRARRGLRGACGACGYAGQCGVWGSAGAWSVCWAALGQERASPPRLQRGGELAARAGWGGHGRGGGGGRGARPG